MDVGKNIRDGVYNNTLSYPRNLTDEGKAARTAYQKREGELIEQFWADAREEFGLVQGNARHDKLCAMAWEYGHANGLSEVLYWVEELRELL